MLQEYLISTRWPVAKISPSKARFKSKSAPRMAYFSSKGSTLITPEIIKPDITAPGVNILAAWHAMGYDNWDFPNYNIDSGTSMACPHVSGVAAMLKALHPNWSPAEIKSALMTTASQIDNTGKRIHSSTIGTATPFELGSGHLDPNAALNPGLVYGNDESNGVILVRAPNSSSYPELIRRLVWFGKSCQASSLDT